MFPIEPLVCVWVVPAPRPLRPSGWVALGCNHRLYSLIRELVIHRICDWNLMTNIFFSKSVIKLMELCGFVHLFKNTAVFAKISA